MNRARSARDAVEPARGTALLALLAVALLAACGDGGSAEASRAAPVAQPSPEELALGEAVYTRACASCHGPAGSGTPQGPPLVHRVYEPSHHGDHAFLLAIRQGVRAHHWRFGDMPPVANVGDEEAGHVIGYVRHLQRAAGIH